MVVVLLSFMKETTVCAIWTNWVAGPGEPPWDDFSWRRNKLLKSHPILDFVSTLQTRQTCYGD